MTHVSLKRMCLLTAWRRTRLGCRLSRDAKGKNGRSSTDKDMKGNLHGYVSAMDFYGWASTMTLKPP